MCPQTSNGHQFQRFFVDVSASLVFSRQKLECEENLFGGGEEEVYQTAGVAVALEE
jgi:hypothetical protein